MPKYALRITANELQKRVTPDEIAKIPDDDLPLLLHFEDYHISLPKTYGDLTVCWVDAKSKTDAAPVYFVVYIDVNNKLRGFLPKHGNLYNPWTATAFGDEKIHDGIHSISNMPKKYWQVDNEHNCYAETNEYHKQFDDVSRFFNMETMENEVCKYSVCK